ncbi:hypothetical protein BOW53_09455 [Solemya pervernicosa gill symbiont]|uniref:Uncharacterized protein n=2 Tax=Gammaproteobacteria incertae sedis TaxID=118884 RepID=A0A1T2L4I0_9GAMM|nr:hypothetical protein [Candidatus Reidiella endopervernicosa]OOZ39999.1 hypothetical protein BOW53_09455 [Solemya pervernicosa gill symbiont]QKQ27793.1 hypothetical protein HUE57_17015 [Candidatus Reidiella endopervernicosa]
MSREKIDHCVEQLCQRGCREVTLIIEQLDAGEAVEGTDHLDGSERHAVAEELRSIMSVYDGPCSI